jgi:signal transduction histidine kinase
MSALSGVGQPSVASRRSPAVAVPGPDATAEALLVDNTYVRLVRWVFTARLVCLALATPAALVGPTSSPVATVALLLLTVSSFVFSRSDRLIATLIRHPLLASLDTAVSIALLVSVSAGQPATLTVVCTALVAGLLFPRRVLVLLMVPLVIGSLGAPATVLSAAPTSWQGWLALVAGLPALVLGVCVIGSVVQRNVQSMVEARQQAAEAVAAVGAAQERARLARDMHDSVGKSIHGISLGSKALRRLVDRDPATAKELAGSLADAADQAAREARALLLSLREGQIDRPTIEVVSEMLRAWQTESGIPARLEGVGAVDAGPVVTQQMTSALGEILHNISKHAQAETVTVRLAGGTDQIELEVTDDGVGFDMSRAASREADGHFGLCGLRERAEQVGGSVEITSANGKGTTSDGQHNGSDEHDGLQGGRPP